MWVSRIGETTWNAVHHYCAGILYLQRSKSELDTATRKRALEDARGEILFTYTRVPSDCPVCGDMAASLAMTEQGLGRSEEAVKVLRTAIANIPMDPVPYCALAVIYRGQRRLGLARETLLTGDAAVNGRSAEIQYNLGLLSVETGDLDDAVVHAQRAYELGHPLPGLRNKLTKLGVWTTAQATR
jgi:Flp pilus assembly protein TadD